MKQHPQPQLNSPPFSFPGLPAPEGRTLLYFILFNSHLFMEGDGRDLPRHVSSRLGSEMSPTSTRAKSPKAKNKV